MKKVLSIVIAMSLLLLAGQAMAEKVMTPESIDGVKTVDADWVKANKDKIKVFDARKKGEYVEGHIPGSISAPYKEKSAKSVDFDPSMDKMKMSDYPADKSIPIVVYCNGVKCWKSYKTIVQLKKAGYSNLNWLRDGFPGWTEKGYPVE
jgi:rhodanese-related sulfurtransferase